MTAIPRGTLIAVWAGLCALALGSWWLGSRGDGDSYRVVTVGVLLFATVKGRLVIRYFMEVGSAPG